MRQNVEFASWKLGRTEIGHVHVKHRNCRFIPAEENHFCTNAFARVFFGAVVTDSIIQTGYGGHESDLKEKRVWTGCHRGQANPDIRRKDRSVGVAPEEWLGLGGESLTSLSQRRDTHFSHFHDSALAFPWF